MTVTHPIASDLGPTRLVVGCMTGTSIDALDAALVEISGRGMSLRAAVRRTLTVPLGDLAAPLRDLAEQRPMPAGQIAELSRRFSIAHADAIDRLRQGEDLHLVCAHGQTVFHHPPTSWQLLTPAILAQRLGCPVVSDLRAMDLAAGGQGAPITPIADSILFSKPDEPRAIVNLGGFCNITLLGGSGAVRGRDLCACNQLLDAIARTLLGAPFDDAGRHALAGSVHGEALEDLDGVLRAQATSRRSLGTGDELGEWISRWRAHVHGSDLAATACEAIAQQIADATRESARLLLAGGGVRNVALVNAIASCASARVEPTSAHGVPPEYREAVAFAVLGALCEDGVPITLPQVTGVARAPVSGSWILPSGPGGSR